ncbi:MAG TPA: helicase-associated domain-containing protein [Micromonosporaceae bacterium]|nr:helicase-associated domain-containing protein [Micromonosporaceae bacterium]
MTATLADHLGALPDNALGALLRLRPDLLVPVPTDLSALAVRAQSRVSVARALDGLDQFTLQVLDAVRLTRDPANGLASTDAVFSLTAAAAHPVEPAAVRAALDRLRALLLVYGPDTALQVVAGVDEVSSPYPAGLGRPAVELDPAAAELCADPARLRRTLLSAPPPARAILDRLAAGPPVGTLNLGAALPPGPPEGEAAEDETTGSPVRWLINRRLLVPVIDASGGTKTGPGAVELPREVGILLRREHGPLGPLQPEPPAAVAAVREPKAADSAGAGQTMEAVRHTEALLQALAAEPAPVLRSGGIGVRDLRRLARTTGLDERNAALLLEVAYAAGLAGELDLTGAVTARGGPEQQILPTARYDLWRASTLAQRWERLAQAWLAMPRRIALVGERDDRDRPITALSAEVERAVAPATRKAVLNVLADLEPGAAPTAEEMSALLAWYAPRRGMGRGSHREVLDEAALLGVTGLGALTTYGRLLLAPPDQASGTTVAKDPLGRHAEAEAGEEQTEAVLALAALLPDPVDHFLIQADLTVVVPGPPIAALAAELEVVAEPESAGGASVHRITAESVRRALDLGYAAEELHELFTQRSRTPVPQALRYLIDDVARRHGGLRVGAAGAYLRSDDEALLAEVLANRRLSLLSLRRLAPTVLLTPGSVNRLLTALREAGYAPLPEDASGVAVLTRPKPRRAPARPTAVSRVTDPLAALKLSQPRLLGIVEQLRRGEVVARAARRRPAPLRRGAPEQGPVPVQSHTQTLAVLQQAIRDKAPVWVGYVDAHGATMSRLVRPVSIGGGFLRAEDERTEMLHTFALHRITAALPEE